MRLAALLAFFVFALGAQVVTLPAGPPRPGAWAGTWVGTFDPELHSNVLKLIELTGDRERMEKSFPKLLSEGKAKIIQAFPDIDPAFGEAWEQRMAARVRVDDFLDVVARAYEKHFTNDEVVGLVAVMTAKKEDKPVKAAPQLRQKLLDETPAIMGEITGGATEVAARLSGQVGREIGTEHPEYFYGKPANSSKP